MHNTVINVIMIKYNLKIYIYVSLNHNNHSKKQYDASI